MKPIVAGVLASVAAFGLLAACGDDPIKTLPTTNSTPSVTVPEGVTIPDGVTLPEGDTIPDFSVPSDSIPSDFSIPQAAIDQMIAQFEAAGMKVDKECFTNLLSDESLRNLVAGGGTPTPEVIQKFFSCIKT